MRVLLVEDSEHLRESLCTALRRTGYAVDATGEGDEGLWLAGSHPYDVVVLDIMLPKLDGLTLLKRMRLVGRSSPAMFLATKDAAADRVHGCQPGAADDLHKPF